MESVTTIYLYLGLPVGVLTLITVLILKILKAYEKKNITFRPRPLSMLMEILDSTIQREFMMRYKLEYELRNLNMVYKFEKDLGELTHCVLGSFSKPFFEEIQYYHTKSYLIIYVTKQLQLALIEFTKAKKIETK